MSPARTQLTQLPTTDLHGVARADIDARLTFAAEQQVATRIFAHDDTLWGTAGAPEVSDRLGWLDIAERMLTEVDELTAFARTAAADGFRHAVVLGMGGSSLAPAVFGASFGIREGALALHVLDSTDAQAVRDIEAQIELERTLFVVSSKSGGTIETLSALHHFWHTTAGNGRQFCAITDPGTALAELAAERDFRAVFTADPEIGGRYSALSPFGIVPAALAGYDIRALLESGIAVAQACSNSDPQANPGLYLGCVLGELAVAGRDKLTFAIDDPIASFGLWVEQLTAESLGKHGSGILPVVDEPLGEPHEYGRDRIFAAIRCRRGRHDERLESLRASRLPSITIDLAGPAELGGLMFLWEFAIATAGWVLALNPFDQPNVQSAKDKTAQVLADLPPEIIAADEQAIAALLKAGPPSYLAICAFTNQTAELDAAIADLRTAIRSRTQMATTFGYGPRYLHSTGQLHKGGPSTGRFLQLLADHRPDIAVGPPAESIEVLKRAQADGDLLVLRERCLPAERIMLGERPLETIEQIIDLL